MKNKKSTLSLMALVAALIFTHPSFAVEIRGKVVEMEGKRAKIEYLSEFAPQKGDDVQIGFKLTRGRLSLRGRRVENCENHP